MTNKYELKFADGYKLIVIGTIDEMLSWIDREVQKHGDCKECLQVIKYDKYIGRDYCRIW